MKIIATIIGLSALIGCAPAPAPPKPFQHVRLSECLSLYNHILTIKIEEAEEDYPRKGETLDVAVTNLREEFHDNGTERIFFQYCHDELKPEQATCMFSARNTDELILCGKNGKHR